MVIKAITVCLIITSISVSYAQSLNEKRIVILDSINYYRELPVERVLANYRLKLNPKQYKPIAPYQSNDRLNHKAQRHANKMARSGNYYHSRMKGTNAESIDAMNDYYGDYSRVVSRLIIDKGVSNKGHRYHMLRHDDKYIGIGVAYGKIVKGEGKNEGQRFIYISIKTK